MRRVHTGPVAGLAGQLVVLTAVSAAVGLTSAGWLAGAAYGVSTTLLLDRGLGRAGHVRLGPADRVTLARSTLVGAVAALATDGFVHPAAAGTMATLAVVSVLLDGVDGRVARHTRTVSALGARFDMEVDAFLIFVLSVYVARSVGIWVLAIGAARYLFVAAGWLWPWLTAALPPRYWCKVVAVIQAVVLTVVVTGVVPHPVAVVGVSIALALLTESFGRDVWGLWRRHRHLVRGPSVQLGPEQRLGGVGRADLDRADLGLR